jgi:hypothetical protein
VHVATQRGHAKRLQHRHSPRVQLVVPMREQHCRHARLPPRRCTVQALSRAQGQPGGAPGRQQQPQRLTMPRDALPTRLSSFCLLAMASPPRDTRRNPLLSQQTSGIVTGADSRYNASSSLACVTTPVIPRPYTTRARGVYKARAGPTNWLPMSSRAASRRAGSVVGKRTTA